MNTPRAEILIPNAALDRSLLRKRGASLLVYIALCSHVNDRGQAEVSTQTLAHACGISQRQARDCLRWLETEAYIIRKPLYGTDGRNLANKIIVLDWLDEA